MADSFTNVFGGSTVQPSEVRYRLITLDANVDLFWPQQGIDTDSVIARWNDVNAVGGFNITFPDATTIGPGQDAVFNNISALTFNVLANDGTTIANITPSMAIYIINVDNSTVAGSWRVVTFGAGTSEAQASALAGAGLMAAAGVLNINIPVQTIGSNYSIVASDRATVLNWTAGAGTITPSDPAAVGFGNGWLCEIRNSGSGALTVAPAAGNIDGNSTKVLNQSESVILHTDGLNYFTVGYGRSVISAFTRLVISVAGNTDVALTSAQAQNQVLEFTGALTGNINVTVPANVAEYFTFNNTTGSHTLTFKTVSGTGVVLAQGNRLIVHCDGTNIVVSNSAGAGTVTSITAGSGLTGGTIVASGTIAIANTAVTPGSYTSANITIGADGRITTAANGSGGSVISVTAGAGLIGGTITTTGTIALPTTGVTAGTYAAPSITVDAFGRITAASSGTGFLPTAGGTITGNLVVNGTTTLHNTLTGTIIAAATNMQVNVATASNAFYVSTVASVRQWASGAIATSGNFVIQDVSGGANRLTIGLAGNATFSNNLTVNGNFNTNAIAGTGISCTTLTAIGADGILLGVTGGQAFYRSAVTSVREWQFGTNTDASFYIFDASAAATRVVINTAGTFSVIQALTVGTTLTTGSNAVINGSVFTNGVTCSSVNNVGSETVAGTVTTTNLQVNNVATVVSTLNASAGIQCAGNGITYTNFDTQRIGWRFNSGTNITFFVNGVNTGSWSFTPSDERIKRNIVPAKGTALDELLKVKLINFDMPDRVDPTRPARHYDYGFSAQQLETVIPEAVIESPSGDLNDTSGETLKGLEVNPLIARCVGAIQQLEARVKALEAQLASK